MSGRRRNRLAGRPTRRVVLVDGSQFAPAMEAVFKEVFATPDGLFGAHRSLVQGNVYRAKSEATMVTSIVARAERLPQSIGKKLLIDMLRYDVGRLTTSLADLRVPVMAAQATYSNV